ncbi:MAG: hypothetical protein DMG69_03770 [Acidobacteria bacterium]|nr:MAG: hypothetical protein DMG69_03770 [Acidobacteriota bacterium]
MLVLDFAMPVMSVLQAAPMLRRMMPRVPIILFMLYADSRLKEEAAAAGIAAVVSKNAAVATLVSKAQLLAPG